ESSYSEAQLEGYDHFWDMVRTERTYYHSARKNGYEEGRAEGEAKGRAEGRAEGEAKGRAEGELEGKLAVARNLKSAGLELGDIAKYTGLSLEALARI
ncbi:MAG: Rpn family recombination-promoting nuclease/putative transposase, partial [Prevotella sp.]